MKDLNVNNTNLLVHVKFEIYQLKSNLRFSTSHERKIMYSQESTSNQSSFHNT